MNGRSVLFACACAGPGAHAAKPYPYADRIDLARKLLAHPEDGKNGKDEVRS